MYQMNLKVTNNLSHLNLKEILESEKRVSTTIGKSKRFIEG